MSAAIIPGGGWMACYLDEESRQTYSTPIVGWVMTPDPGDGEIYEVAAYDTTFTGGETGRVEFTGWVVLWHRDVCGDGALNSHADATAYLRRIHPAVAS